MTEAPRGTAREVFWAFLRLGLTSFGGPTAHLGYFHAEFVERRGWLRDRDYTDLLALCQILPGPSSSQLGFGLGLRRAGLPGAVAAFLAFTLPSAILMGILATGVTFLKGPLGSGILFGLQSVAVAVVAHAVIGMARTLTPDLARMGIGLLALAATLVWPGGGVQLLAIALGAAAGTVCCDAAARTSMGAVSAEHSGRIRPAVSRAVGVTSLALFCALVLPAVALGRLAGEGWIALVAACLRAGSFVFGGGHVALPLLHAEFVATGWVPAADFYAGYGAAQAMPGPLFSFAAYLGSVASIGPGGATGGTLALVAMFIPGFLLLLGALPFWALLRRSVRGNAALLGAGAAVLGLLGAALVHLVAEAAGGGLVGLGIALACAVALWQRVPAWAVVLSGAAAGGIFGVISS